MMDSNIFEDYRWADGECLGLDVNRWLGLPIGLLSGTYRDAETPW